MRQIELLCIPMFLLTGCPDSHMLMPGTDSGPAVMPISDAGFMPGTDSGSYEWPDAGPIGPDSGRAELDSGPVDPPEGGVTVICGLPGDDTLRETVTETVGYPFYGFRVVPNDRPVRLSTVQIDFGWSGRTLSGSVGHGGRTYFDHWQLTADFPFRIFNTEAGVPTPETEDRRYHVQFVMRDSGDVITEDTLITVRANITDEDFRHSVTMGEYTTEYVHASFVYEDTGEVVEFVFTDGCRSGREAPVYIRLREADIIVDRQFGEPSATVTSGAGRTTFLHLFALNEGASDGTLDRITMDTRAVVITAEGAERTASIHDAVSACHIVRDGRILATGRFEGEQLVFDHAGVLVTTDDRGTSLPDDFAGFTVDCDVRLNSAILPLFGALRVWLGAQYSTGFTLEEEAPARVSGTLSLVDNTNPLNSSSRRYVQIVR